MTNSQKTDALVAMCLSSKLNIPNYSTRLEDAWLILEQLPAFPVGTRDFRLEYSGGIWTAMFGRSYGADTDFTNRAEGRASTAPLAICRAVIRAFGGNPDEITGGDEEP